MSEEFQQVDVTIKVTFSAPTKLSRNQLENYVDHFVNRLQHPDLMQVEVVRIAEEAETYGNV